jgi:hypothetical protein
MRTFEGKLLARMDYLSMTTMRLSEIMTNRGLGVSQKKVQRWLRVGAPRPMRWEMDTLMRMLRLDPSERWEFLEAYID